MGICIDFEMVGARIKNCRRKKNWTQEKFAEMIDVSPHYIYEIERGSKTMSIYTLDSVASTLGVSTDYLLYGIPSSDARNSLNQEPDKLSLYVETIPPRKRDSVAEIMKAILPYVK